MKPFLLFAGEDHEPNGGIDDLVGDFESVEEAKVAWSAEIAGDDRGRWGQIVRHDTMEAVEWLTRHALPLDMAGMDFYWHSTKITQDGNGVMTVAPSHAEWNHGPDSKEWWRDGPADGDVIRVTIGPG